MKLLLENFIAESMANKFPYLWSFIAAACFFIVAYRYIFHRYCLYLGNDYDPQDHISGITYILTVASQSLDWFVIAICPHPNICILDIDLFMFESMMLLRIWDHLFLNDTTACIVIQ